MKKLIITGDHHVANHYPFSTSGFPFKDLFFMQAVNNLKFIAKYAAANDCVVLSAGDLVDDAEIGPAELFGIMSAFAAFENRNVTVMMNIGNHDQGYETIPSVVQSIVVKHKGFHTIGFKKAWTELQCNGVHYYLIPYYKEAVFNSVLKDVLSQDIQQPAVLCIHQNIKGIQVNNAVIQDGLSEQEICTLVKKKFKFVVCGHIHNRHYGDRYGLPLIIPGSTIAMDFKDLNSEKSFYVVEFDQNYDIKDLKTVPLPQVTFSRQVLSEWTYAKNSDHGNMFYELECGPGEEEKFAKVKADLIENCSAVGVRPKWRKKNYSDDLTAQQRPIEMTMDDWLTQYMERKHYNAEEIQSTLDLNKATFEKEG